MKHSKDMCWFWVGEMGQQEKGFATKIYDLSSTWVWFPGTTW